MLKYYPNYITKDKERQILSVIPPFEKTEDTEYRNRVFRYGSRFPYASFFVSEDIPEVFKSIGIENFDSITINEYDKNQSIKYHIDNKNAGDKIVVLSILGNAEIKFRNPKDNQLIQSIIVEPLSLYIMDGDFRWIYEHSAIAQELRYSVVFRLNTTIGEQKTIDVKF